MWIVPCICTGGCTLYLVSVQVAVHCTLYLYRFLYTVPCICTGCCTLYLYLYRLLYTVPKSVQVAVHCTLYLYRLLYTVPGICTGCCTLYLYLYRLLYTVPGICTGFCTLYLYPYRLLDGNLDSTRLYSVRLEQRSVGSNLTVTVSTDKETGQGQYGRKSPYGYGSKMVKTRKKQVDGVLECAFK